MQRSNQNEVLSPDLARLSNNNEGTAEQLVSMEHGGSSDQPQGRQPRLEVARSAEQHQKFKSLHPRVSINVEFQIDLSGELVRSITHRIDEKRWKMISSDVSESMSQDDCTIPSGEKV